MKKIILLALTAVMMAGCDEVNTQSITKSIAKDAIKRNGIVVEIDSCEYVINDAYGGFSYTHHGNCRFCKARREAELKQLVEQLKDK